MVSALQTLPELSRRPSRPSTDGRGAARHGHLEPAPARMPTTTAEPTGPWFIVHTVARAEWMAHRALRQTGIHTFYPHFPGTVRHARRCIGVLLPLYPRYLFAQLPLGRSLAEVNRAPGVSTVVYRGPEPLEVPPLVMESEFRRADEKGRLLPEELIRLGLAPSEQRRYEHQFRPGQAVRFGRGPFADLCGVVARLDSNDALRVWLRVFGREVEVGAVEGDLSADEPVG